MIERAIEHWLTNTNERGYEIPYCQLLLAKGHSVLHLSSHGCSEEGKDIISLAPDGTPCAFQLKSKARIGKSELREMHHELVELVEMPIRYPGVPQGAAHRAYLVTNGVMTETGRVHLDHLNTNWRGRGYAPVEVVPRGTLLKEFLEHQGKFLPVALTEFQLLLGLLLRDGRDMLPKVELSRLLESVLMPAVGYKAPSTQVPRSIASALLLTGYVLGNHYSVDNHVAVLEGWVVFCAYVMAMAERYRLKPSTWEPSFTLALQGAERAAQDLISEMKTRSHFVENHDVLYDGMVYRARLVLAISYLASMALYRRLKGCSDWVDSDLDNLIARHLHNMWIWGESAIPLMFMLSCYCGVRLSPIHGEKMLFTILDAVLIQNGRRGNNQGLPDPYHNLESCLDIHLGLGDSMTEEFCGISYVVQPIVHHLARRLWRQNLGLRWRSISRILAEEFVPEHSWQTFVWCNEAEGRIRAKAARERQSWAQLKHDATELCQEQVPGVLRAHPEFLPLFLCVYPHRFNSTLVAFLDSQI